ncbi:MAG: ribbon-helix-helix domain-containing protein [Candidatus Thermoplasmatota archaeon]|jgi:CopG family nickel-responsive transcriptional regulator|nr:ribbon-helix-helix domain-containing protein [Candidatus Thermoplasmatota archaeon]MCL5988178.1 ribbon-helix-helix domain-containing protein [Candidatus Thermoplasmatota archaeon]
MSVPYRVTIRVSEDDLQKLIDIRDKLKYETISDVIRDSIKDFMEKFEENSNVTNLNVKITKKMMQDLEKMIESGEAVSIDELIRVVLREYTSKIVDSGFKKVQDHNKRE